MLPEYNETGSVALFEQALDKFLVDSAKSYSMKKPLGIGPIIGFLSQKEVEVKNLNSLNNVLLMINLLIFTYICLEIAENS